MALLNGDTKRVFLGVGLGMAGALVASSALPILVSVGRPLVKALLKQGMLGALHARERLAVLGETLEDIYAEVRAEVNAELVRRSPRPEDTGDEGSDRAHSGPDSSLRRAPEVTELSSERAV
jgi:hypothetical protein